MERQRERVHDDHVTREADAGTAPGKRALTDRLPVQLRSVVGAPLVDAAPAPAARPHVGDDPFGMHLVGSSAGSATGPTGMPTVVQAKMEAAFGHDFSSVRIHQGPEADALGARAYTQGSDIHFANGEYAPHDPQGQALLGHELAHVVQQSQGRVAATTQAKGLPVNDDGGLEHEADVAGAQAARGERVTMTGAGGASGARTAVQAKAAGAPIQMVAKQTHGGTFTDETYRLNGNDIDMVLKFTPRAPAEATKIGLTQSLRSYIGGNNDQIDPSTAKRTSGTGHFIDRISERNNPIYGGQQLGRLQGLKNTNQTNNGGTYELGHRTRNGNNWDVQDAKLDDSPSIEGGNNSGKEFETTALAIEGKQKGTYYGSVKWGWQQDNLGNVSLIDFDVVSMGLPSKDFLGAATEWNGARAQGSLVPKADNTNVYDGPGMNVLFTMDTDEVAEQDSASDLNGVSAVFFTVRGGAHDGQQGYGRVVDFDDAGDGDKMKKLPTPRVKVTTQAATLYKNIIKTKTVATLMQGRRVKVLATAFGMSKVEVGDGMLTGDKGWVASADLTDE